MEFTLVAVDYLLFVAGEKDGILLTNIYFQENMQGYLNFDVMVRDWNESHSAVANVSVRQSGSITS